MQTLILPHMRGLGGRKVVETPKCFTPVRLREEGIVEKLRCPVDQLPDILKSFGDDHIPAFRETPLMTPAPRYGIGFTGQASHWQSSVRIQLLFAIDAARLLFLFKLMAPISVHVILLQQ